MSTSYNIASAPNREVRNNQIGNAIQNKQDQKGHWENFMLRSQEYFQLCAAGCVGYEMTCEEEFQETPKETPSSDSNASIVSQRNGVHHASLSPKSLPKPEKPDKLQRALPATDPPPVKQNTGNGTRKECKPKPEPTVVKKRGRRPTIPPTKEAVQRNIPKSKRPRFRPLLKTNSVSN